MPLKTCLTSSQFIHVGQALIRKRNQYLEVISPLLKVKELPWKSLKPILKRYIQDPSNKEFNSLPFHLRYAYFSESSSLPIIISSSFLSALEEKKISWGFKKA